MSEIGAHAPPCRGLVTRFGGWEERERERREEAAKLGADDFMATAGGASASTPPRTLCAGALRHGEVRALQPRAAAA